MGSSLSRLGISQYIVFVQQPLEHLVLGDAAFHLLQPPTLFQLCVDLARVRSSLLGLLRNAIVEILLGSGKTFLLGDRLDDEVAPDLPLGHLSELARELLALVGGNLVRFRVILNELLHPAFGNVEGVGRDDLIDQLLSYASFYLVFGMPLQVRADSLLESIK